MRTEGFEPTLPKETDFRATSAFAAALRRSWPGLSLRRRQFPGPRRHPSSLYTFSHIVSLARD